MNKHLYYIYQITNTINGKIYIGVHQTSDVNDGYMGSGTVIRRSISKYGSENFKKEILEYFDSYDDALSKEKEIVTDEFLSRKDVYNLRRGGNGGFGQYHCKLAQSVHRMNKASRTAEYQLSPKTCARCLSPLDYSKRRNKFCSKSCAAEFNNIQRSISGYQITESHRNKVSEKMSGRTLDTMHKDAIRRSRVGRRYIRNDATGHVKSVHENDLEEWLKNGYRIGRYPK